MAFGPTETLIATLMDNSNEKTDMNCLTDSSHLPEKPDEQASSIMESIAQEPNDQTLPDVERSIMQEPDRQILPQNKESVAPEHNQIEDFKQESELEAPGQQNPSGDRPLNEHADDVAGHTNEAADIKQDAGEGERQEQCQSHQEQLPDQADEQSATTEIILRPHHLVQPLQQHAFAEHHQNQVTGSHVDASYLHEDYPVVSGGRQHQIDQSSSNEEEQPQQSQHPVDESSSEDEVKPKLRQRQVYESFSEDDEPLIERRKHFTSKSEISGLASEDGVFPRVSPTPSSQGSKAQDTEVIIKDEQFEREFFTKEDTPPAARKPRHSSRTSPVVPSSPSDVGAEISWKLPTYEVYRDNTNPKDPITKVSLPGLVREEILLSPDHEEQEIELLVNVFIPGQQGRDTPDSEPAKAVLNFHIIAVMVVETFHQFKIGDGMPHGYSQEDVGNGTDAKSADENEIFFAVIDRWRSGMTSNKRKYGSIRGIQEFCDIALDLIYYIKEHGLLCERPKARKQHKDKGVKKGTRTKKNEKSEEPTILDTQKSELDEEPKPKKGVKRAAPTNANVLQARKKPKTEKAVSKAKGKAKTKAKAKDNARGNPKGKAKAKSKKQSTVTVLKPSKK